MGVSIRSTSLVNATFLVQSSFLKSETRREASLSDTFSCFVAELYLLVKRASIFPQLSSSTKQWVLENFKRYQIASF